MLKAADVMVVSTQHIINTQYAQYENISSPRRTRNASSVDCAGEKVLDLMASPQMAIRGSSFD